MNKKEAITQLTRRAFEIPYYDDNTFEVVHLTVVEEIIEMLDEPVKPVIPKHVADWIKKMKQQSSTLGEVAEQLYSGNVTWSLLKNYERWARLYFSTFSRAWLGGYEVEQEKLYTMAVPYTDIPVHYFVYEDGKMSWKQGNTHKFTWAEIEKYFPEIKDKAKEETE